MHDLILAILLKILDMDSASLESQDKPKFRGKVRIPWAERGVTEYIDYLEKKHPQLADMLGQMPFVKFK